MSDYASNLSFEQAVSWLRAGKRCCLTTHAKPDGDALGSLLAMAETLDLCGLATERWIMPPLPQCLKALTAGARLHYHADQSQPFPADDFDRIVVLDTGSWAQLEPLKSWLQKHHEKILVIDHHLHGNDVGARLFIRPEAAATAQIVADFVRAFDVVWTPSICRALYAGLATDTGWFRFSNTTVETFTLAADLVRRGTDHALLYRQIEQSERPQKLALLQRALASLQLVCGGRAAVMTLKLSDFVETGTRPEETERFVDIPQLVESVEAVVLVVQSRATGPIRLSFRSKPGPDAVDVNALANRFGGGGHARASGAKMDTDPETARSRVIQAMEELMAADKTA